MPSFFSSPPQPMLVILWLSFALVILYLLLKLAVSSRLLLTWMTVRMHDTPFTFVDLMGMALRRVDYRKVVMVWLMADKVGIQLEPRQLEMHQLAGGHIEKVAAALHLAREHDLELTWDQACALDRSGQDVVAETRTAAGLEAPDDLRPLSALREQSRRA